MSKDPLSQEVDWYDRAVRLLARREHSQFELRRKLKQKGAPQDQIESILKELIENNYQSDCRFAHGYVRYRTQSGFGPLRIQAELRQRGVSTGLISEALSQSSDFWFDQLKALCERRFRGKLSENQQEYARQVRFLLQRGFSSAMVSRLPKESDVTL